jgi:hypothetical protein
MTRFSPRRFQSESARKMAGLVFVRDDLRHVARCCDELAKADLCTDQKTILQALLDSALVRYRRCFKNGVRTLITEFLEALPAVDRRFHDYMVTYCDKHIAHSVNNFETIIPVVYVGIDTNGSLKRGGVGAKGHLLFMISKEEAEHLRGLALHFVDQVDSWEKELRAIVAQEASELTDAQLLKLEDALAYEWNPDVGKSRPSNRQGQ